MSSTAILSTNMEKRTIAKNLIFKDRVGLDQI